MHGSLQITDQFIVWSSKFQICTSNGLKGLASVVIPLQKAAWILDHLETKRLLRLHHGVAARTLLSTGYNVKLINLL